MAKIITVYVDLPRREDVDLATWQPSDMSYIRWFKISEALADHGHEVDMALPDGTLDWPVDPALLPADKVGFKALSQVVWKEYDVVKTLFNRGIRTLEMHGGIAHPCIISKLGSVVGPVDMPGIYFYGETRAAMYAAQQKISQSSAYVSLLSKAAIDLWIKCHGNHPQLLLVPGGVDHEIPAVGEDPYPDSEFKRCLFAGHIYARHSQPEANAVICCKLNELGKLLAQRGIHLYMMGSGDTSALDRKYVSLLGVVPYTGSWNYLYHADVGIVVSAGSFMHNNESSKIYHYLRAGLPTVSETGFPNGELILDAELGYLSQSGDMALMADQIVLASRQDWHRDKAMDMILNQHSWHQRTKIYDSLITRAKFSAERDA